MKLYQGDCLEVMKEIPDKSVDMILCDLPYGLHISKWDKIIDFEKMWNEYKRIIKDRHAIVLFSREPFASKLRLSNIQMYKYDWIWEKNVSGDCMNAKVKPLNKHEIICVFSNGKTSPTNPNNMVYYPQGLMPYGKKEKSGNKPNTDGTKWRPSIDNKPYIRQFTNYPDTVLHFQTVNSKEKTVHPTQKPVPLLEYLIKTYTNEGETVLDNCMGAGSTGVACVNLNRDFIVIELDEQYFQIAKDRIEKAEAEKKG